MPFFVKTDSLFLSTPSARRATHICVGKRGEVWDFYPRPPRGGRPRPDPLWTGCRRNFYPRPPRGGRLLLAPGYLSTSSNFYPRPPRGGRRSAVRGATWRIFYFYPRPPRGGRPLAVWPLLAVAIFLSTPSARRATLLRSPSVCISKLFLSTPSARRATKPLAPPFYFFIISIHALREEGDSSLMLMPSAKSNFYPRPPRGGRPSSSAPLLSSQTFLSTPSARRATAKTEKNISAFVSL